MNQIKTYILMALLTILLVWIGSLVGGRNGAIFALAFAGVMNFGVYWFSDRPRSTASPKTRPTPLPRGEILNMQPWR
jgi:hypothetical protein